MMRPGWPGDGTPSIESPRELRLRALLNDLVNDLGPGKLAEQFGVDRKTLWRWQRAAELPPRLAEALERAVAAMEEDRKRVGALEQRVRDLEGQLAEALAALNGGGSGNVGAADVDNAVAGALRQEFTREIQRLERWLGGPGAGVGTAYAVTGAAVTGRAGSQRRYDDLVTREHTEDDKEVCGVAPGGGVAGVVGGASAPGQGAGLDGEAAADPGAGDRHAGRARADPAAGDGAAGWPGPAGAVVLAGAGAGAGQAADQAGVAALGTASADPG